MSPQNPPPAAPATSSAPVETKAPVRPQRLWIVEDQDTFRQLLAEYLPTLPGIQVVGNSGTREPMLAAAAAGEIDLVTLDLDLGATGGFTIARDILALPKPPAILILTSNTTEHAVFVAAELGARGFVNKSDSLQTIALAIQRIAAGGTYFTKEPKKPEDAEQHWSKLDRVELSRREINLLVALLNGRTIKDAADELQLSIWSTYKLRSALLLKTGARTNEDLLHYATGLGLAGSADKV